jgi:hypothetical protein
MGRKKLNEGKVLRHAVKSRINDDTYRKLQSVLEKSKLGSLSALIRSILSDRPVVVFTVDNNLVVMLEELSKMRSEFNAVGRNINQVVKNFNSTGSVHEKHMSVLLLIDEQQYANKLMAQYIEMVSKIADKWLQ